MTLKGRKKALKYKEEYSRITGGKQLRKFSDNPSNQSKKASGSKSIADMSNAEIVEKINRLHLEQRLSSMMPDTRSKGQKFMASIGDTALDMVKTKGTKLVGDYIDTQLRNKLGIGDKKMTIILLNSRKWPRIIQIEKIIDDAQQRFKEGPYAEKQDKKI